MFEKITLYILILTVLIGCKQSVEEPYFQPILEADYPFMLELNICQEPGGDAHTVFDDSTNIPIPICDVERYSIRRYTDDIVIVYSTSSYYCGSGGCHVVLYKKTGDAYTLVQDLWGWPDIANSTLEYFEFANTFHYMECGNESSIAVKVGVEDGHLAPVELIDYIHANCDEATCKYRNYDMDNFPDLGF